MSYAQAASSLAPSGGNFHGSALDSILLFGYLAVVLVLGWAGARRSRRPAGEAGEGLAEYVLASRALTLPLFVATLVPSFYGGVLGIGEFTWQKGISNWLVMGLPYYVFAAVYAVWIGPRVRLEPGLTIPDHIEGVYGPALAVFAAGLVFLLASPADGLVMLGILLGHFFGWNLPVAMAAGEVFVLLLLVRGGLRSDVWANVLQLAIMFVGFAVILPFAFSRFGGWGSLRSLLPSGHLVLGGTLSPAEIAGWWLIAIWTIVDPIFHQRTAAAADTGTARTGIFVSILFWAIFDAMTTFSGLYARAAFPSLAQPLMAFPRLADELLPVGFRGLFFAALVSAILASLQGKALQSAISLGKDGFGRVLRIGTEAQKRLIQIALLVSVSFGYLIALAIPSVVGIWYALGSMVVPALLWPFLSIYFPRLRIGPSAAFAACAGGFALSAGWVVAGRVFGHPPFHLEPFIPGFGCSAVFWAAGLGLRGRTNTSGPS